MSIADHRRIDARNSTLSIHYFLDGTDEYVVKMGRAEALRRAKTLRGPIKAFLKCLTHPTPMEVTWAQEGQAALDRLATVLEAEARRG